MSKNKIILRCTCVLFILFLMIFTIISCNKSEELQSDVSDSGDISESETFTDALTDTAETETEEIIEPVTIPEEDEEVITEVDTNLIETEETKEVFIPVSNDPKTLLPKAERLTSNFINMLTGEAATEEEYYRRPMAIMINNIKKSLPQIGISQADVIYECTVEGGLTRLMMLVNDYSSCSEIGSIRSSREYYLNFAANHNAIYMHAGGSGTAYDEIQRRRINNLDFVNGGLPAKYCYRDEWRKSNMGYEHSLMTDGERIAEAVAYKKYETKINDTYVSSFNFVDYNGGINSMNGGGDAKHVIITYNSSHFPQFIYTPSSETYKRFQYNGMPHMDGGNDIQLEFTNVLILNMVHSYSGDSYGHIYVETVGSGDGYYISGGKYIPIKWSTEANDRPMILTNTDGTLLYMNCGKTFVNIVNENTFSSVNMNYTK